MHSSAPRRIQKIAHFSIGPIGWAVIWRTYYRVRISTIISICAFFVCVLIACAACSRYDILRCKIDQSRTARVDGLDTRRIRCGARDCAFDLLGKFSEFVNIY